MEYLASYREVPLSILHDLIETLPEFPDDDYAERVGERVALRCLEEMSGPSNGTTNEVLPESGTGFEFSETCADVLQSILEEISASGLENAGPERLKLDIQSFVTHKRPSMKRCALEKLKELAGGKNQLIAAALKIKSGLIQVDESSRKNGNVSNTNAVSGMYGPRGLDPRGVAIDGDLVLKNLKDNELQDVMHNEFLSSIKRPGNGLAAGSSGILVSGHGNVLDEAGNTEPIATPCKLVADMKDGVSDELPESNDPNLHIKSLNPLSAETAQQVYPHETNSALEGERLGDGDEFEIDCLNLASVKESFLSSCCKSNQNPLGEESWIDKKLCVKCNSNGDTLACSTSKCPLIVHRCCLPSAPSSDNKGHFYCPFCAYTSSILEYQESKKKVSNARKELTHFISVCFGPFPKELSEELVKELGHSSPTGKENHPTRTNVNEHSGDDEQDENQTSLLQKVGVDKLQSGSFSTGSRHGSVPRPGEQEKTTTVSGGNKKVVHQCPSVEVAQLIQDQTLADPICDNVQPSTVNNETVVQSQGEVEGRMCEQNLLPDSSKSSEKPVNSETIVKNQGEVKGRIYEQNLLPRRRGSSKRPVCAVTDEGNGSSDADARNFKKIRDSVRRTTIKPQYSSPAIPLARRNIIKWTAEEEEMLKVHDLYHKLTIATNQKGVQMHGLAWKKILEFGGSAFLDGRRTAIDLKDKWRNMRKANPELISR